MQSIGAPRVRLTVLILQAAVLCLLVFPFVSAAFRDNDQAAILSGSWQIAHYQAGFLHATFYNFDKQWGTFLALGALYRLFPSLDPVLAANAALVFIASLAWISLGIRMGRTRKPPLALVLPILLSPVLILYMPFLGTGWFSLAFLLLAFFFLGNTESKPSQAIGFLLVAVAAACRADVVLSIPALVLSQSLRTGVLGLLRRPFLWIVGAATIIPVYIGKSLAGATIPDANPLSFDPKAYFGFLLFGLTPSIAALLLVSTLVWIWIAARKRRFWFFYAAMAVAPLVPFVFYSLQLYTLRYLFLTIASVLFVVSSRRSVCLFRSFARYRRRAGQWTAAALVALTVTPWLVGLNVPALDDPSLTVSNPTRFPTGDGRFPTAAYLAFQAQVLFRDHLAIDHNQQIWLSSRIVRYQSCPDGTVPFLVTPMSNYIEFAIRLQNKKPRTIDYMAQSPCGLAYVDARSIIRGYRPNERDGPMFKEQITFASSAGNGQLIARIDAKGKQTEEARALENLRSVLGERNTEIFLSPSSIQIGLEPGLEYAVFSGQPCQIALSGNNLPVRLTTHGLVRGTWTSGLWEKNQTASIACSDSFSGWARTVSPAYMGPGSRY